MAMPNQQPMPTFDPKESYNTALQLHNQEFRTLGERTNAFLIVQSILVAAFVMIRVNPELFPYAFPFISGGLSMVGIFFCLLQYWAGKLGAQAASRWRRYMLQIENHYKNAPWNWFTRDCENSWLEKRLLNKPPLPNAWLISPAIFFLVWLSAIAYTVVVCSANADFCKYFPFDELTFSVRVFLIVAGVIALLIFCGIACWLFKK